MVFISAVVIWEIHIKAALGKLIMDAHRQYTVIAVRLMEKLFEKNRGVN